MATTVIEPGRLLTAGESAARTGTLPKAPTGIGGLDEVTGDGLPRGRPTLVCGPAGCGRTLLAMEGNGEHNRVLYVLKSRGMAHSNQIREFLLTDQGIELADVYVGPQGVLTGSARQAQEAQERFDGTAWLEDLEQRRVNLERRRESVEAHTAALWRDFEDEADIVGRLLAHGWIGFEDRAGQRAEQGRHRPARQHHTYRRHRRGCVVNVVNCPHLLTPAAGEVWHLRLYVAGQSPKSLHALANSTTLWEEHLGGQYEIEVVDLVENASRARSDDVLAIPTLVRLLPAPLRKIIGDLSNTERVLVGLRLQPASSR